MDLRPFQKTFIRRALSPNVDTAALSIPRGNGKTTLAGLMVANALNPDHRHYAGDRKEVVLFAGSIEQCRLVYRQAMEFLPNPNEYRTVDSATRVAITHKRTRTRLKAIGSNPKTSLGLVGVPLAILDEPGALHTVGGAALWDSVVTAQGKPGSKLKVVSIGTLAPAASGSWWPDLVAGGSRGSRYVQVLQADRKKWSDFREVLRVNPLARLDAGFKAKLREELDEALADSRLKARFLSYRLNVPAQDESSLLLTVDEWEAVEGRPQGSDEGRPILGLDLGGGRAWSSGVAVWPSGRVEAFAVAPGTPSIHEQEKRDRVPRGTYQRLADLGVLTTDGDLRVPRVSTVLDRALRWRPRYIVADRFRLDELKDASRGRVRLVPRVTRWSEASDDIRGLRRMALDGPLSVDPKSAKLIAASLAVAVVKSDDQGSQRLVKGGSNNQARDDVAAALLLAVGAASREKPPRRVYLGRAA